jgi:hypothetical protein
MRLGDLQKFKDFFGGFAFSWDLHDCILFFRHGKVCSWPNYNGLEAEITDQPAGLTDSIPAVKV